MSEPDPRLGLRRSVLDAIVNDFRDFKKGLGQADSQRLDQHLTGIRDLERRIARLEEAPADLAACTRPDRPTEDFESVDGRPQLSARNRALCDVAVMALACDQTRVVSNFITKPLTNLLLAGASAGHHQLTHDEPDEQPQVHAIIVSIMEELRYFIEALRAIPEGDGTLLDHMVLLATSDVSYGRTHALDEFPLLWRGSQWAFKDKYALSLNAIGKHQQNNAEHRELMESMLRPSVVKTERPVMVWGYRNMKYMYAAAGYCHSAVKTNQMRSFKAAQKNESLNVQPVPPLIQRTHQHQAFCSTRR